LISILTPAATAAVELNRRTIVSGIARTPAGTSENEFEKEDDDHQTDEKDEANRAA
jgi:hypothetical protein